MPKEILYTIALDENGNLIPVKDAKKGNLYSCPCCKNEFDLKKSGNTGKGSKRPHFAHKNLTPNCTPEGVLHYSFKRKLIDLLEKTKLESKALEVNWSCNECLFKYANQPISRNLLEKTTTIEEEYNLKDCRPDIALLNEEKNVIAAIEIVVTHEPEETALNYFKKHGITLIQINLSSHEDLDYVEEKITNPDLLNYCINPKCKNFSNHEVNRKLNIVLVICKNCGQKVKTFILESSSVFGKIGTPYLTENELTEIKSYGVNLEIKTDGKTGIKYPIVKCLTCELNKKRVMSKYSKRRF